jgi:hypothetical protein
LRAIHGAQNINTGKYIMANLKFSKEANIAFEKISDIANGNLAKLEKMQKGDDWSFIIKCIALVESSLNRLLTSKTKDDKFEKLFGKMSVSSKINMAFELGFFTSKYEKNFINYLISLRNKLAHDPNEIDFRFTTFFECMTNDEMNQFKKNMKIDDEEKDDTYYDFILKYPKEGISVLLNSILSVFAYHQEFNKVNNWIDESSYTDGRSILSDFIDNQISDIKETK